MEKIDWISSREAFKPAIRPKVEPKIDKEVSKAVGFNVPVNNSKLIKMVASWKQQGGLDDTPQKMDNFLKDPSKVEELKRVLNTG